MERDRSRPGQFHLPDKEFRYLRTVRHCYSRPGEVGGSVISAELFASPRRPDYLITIRADRVWRIVSEDFSSPLPLEPFLLISRTARIVTATWFVASSGGSTGVPSIWPDFITTVVRFYSYGRRLPGLQFRASPCG